MRFGKKPKRKDGILKQELGKEILLYNAENKEVHVLNPTANRLWDLCDGNHSAGDMEQELRSTYAVREEHNLKDDICHTLETFESKNLLECDKITRKA